jgi:hypothetical protein
MCNLDYSADFCAFGIMGWRAVYMCLPEDGGFPLWGPLEVIGRIFHNVVLRRV